MRTKRLILIVCLLMFSGCALWTESRTAPEPYDWQKSVRETFENAKKYREERNIKTKDEREQYPLLVGMSFIEVYELWGTARNITEFTTAQNISIVLEYGVSYWEYGYHSPDHTLYFLDNVLVEIIKW